MSYGYRRICLELHNRGSHINHKKSNDKLYPCDICFIVVAVVVGQSMRVDESFFFIISKGIYGKSAFSREFPDSIVFLHNFLLNDCY